MEQKETNVRSIISDLHTNGLMIDTNSESLIVIKAFRNRTFCEHETGNVCSSNR